MADRLLAIDYGTKFIGLAVADFPGITARALETLRQDKKDPIAAIREVVQKEKVNKFIVGFPDSEVEGEIHRQIKNFAETLKRHFPEIPVEFFDESFSSLEADELIRQTGLGRKSKRRMQDAQAAKILLLRYLDRSAGIA